MLHDLDGSIQRFLSWSKARDDSPSGQHAELQKRMLSFIMELRLFQVIIPDFFVRAGDLG